MNLQWFLASNNNWYSFWSGFGSCLTEFAILAVVFRKVNCSVTGCWRLGLHHVNGTQRHVCLKHHPVRSKDNPLTAADVAAEHREANR